MKWPWNKPTKDRSRVEIELSETFGYLREVEDRLKRMNALATSILVKLRVMQEASEDEDSQSF